MYRLSLSHAENTGSTPVGDTNNFKYLTDYLGGSILKYGTIYGKDAYKHPRITTDSLSAI